MNFSRRSVVGVLLVVAGFALAAVSLTRPVSGDDSESWIARGVGTTIVSALGITSGLRLAVIQNVKAETESADQTP